MEDIAVDSTGNAYVSDMKNHQIYRITGQGQISLFAGNGVAGNKDGKGLVAQFNKPSDLVMDNQDTLFVCDQGNHLIRRVSKDGTVLTLAGTGSDSGGDALGTIANPTSIDVDNAQQALYVLSSYQYWHYVRKIEVPPTLW